MFSLSDRVPEYLLGKFQLISTVTFTLLFSLVFLLLSIPYNHNVWFELTATKAFGYSVVFFTLAVFMICVSKRTMFLFRNSENMTFLTYILWNGFEVVAVSLLYTFFTVKGDQLGIINLKMPIGGLMFNAFVYSLISLGIPYVIAAMFFAIQDKNNTIRMINYGNVVSDETPAPHDEQKITLFDSSGVLKLSVSAKNLYYIESDDNYIKVWYSDTKGVLKQYMLRCRLKTIEDSFSGSDLVRCHRKYIVNMSKVDILSSEKDGYVLDLGNESIDPIPVSKTYEEQVLARFNSR